MEPVSRINVTISRCNLLTISACDIVTLKTINCKVIRGIAPNHLSLADYSANFSVLLPSNNTYTCPFWREIFRLPSMVVFST